MLHFSGFRGFTLALAVVCLAVTQSSSAAPYFSEIFLPSSPRTGIEIAGIDTADPAGLSVLVINARPAGGMSVREKYVLSASDLSNSVALLSDADWSTLGVPNVLPAQAQSDTDSALDIDGFVSLVLFSGTTDIGVGFDLGAITDNTLFTDNVPIDWIGFRSLSAAPPGFDIRMPDAQEREDWGLNDAGLALPVADIDGAQVLARGLSPMLGGPVLDTLLKGSINSIDGSPLNAQDFFTTPGQTNPQLQAIPEPASALLLLIASTALLKRRRHSQKSN